MNRRALRVYRNDVKAGIPAKRETPVETVQQNEPKLITPLEESNVKNIFIQGVFHRWIGCKAKKTSDGPYILPTINEQAVAENRSDNSADPPKTEDEEIETIVLQDDIGEMEREEESSYLRRFVKGCSNVFHLKE